MRYGFLSACLAIAMCVGPVCGQEQPDQGLLALCEATLKALQATEAAPLADLLSFQASSLLVVCDGELLRSRRAELKDRDEWAEQALLSASARLADVEVSDNSSADFVRATIEDEDITYVLDGVATVELGQTRWLMLLVAPLPGDNAPDDAAEDTVLKELSALRGATASGGTQRTMARLAPDSLCFAVEGPDSVFYVVPRPEEVRAFIESQATAMGPMSLTPRGTPEAVVVGPAAIVRLRWDVGIAGFEPMSMDLRVHAYRADDRWRISGLCAPRIRTGP
jgi:hypothetical protein